MSESKYYAVNDIGLASSLSYLGFHYMRFDDDVYGKVYSFHDTDDFREARLELIKLKNKYKDRSVKNEYRQSARRDGCKKL